MKIEDVAEDHSRSYERKRHMAQVRFVFQMAFPRLSRLMLEQKIKKYDQARNKPECLIYGDPETQCICLRDPDPDGVFDCKECCWNNKNKKI